MESILNDIRQIVPPANIDNKKKSTYANSYTGHTHYWHRSEYNGTRYPIDYHYHNACIDELKKIKNHHIALAPQYSAIIHRCSSHFPDDNTVPVSFQTILLDYQKCLQLLSGHNDSILV